jgi:hypothetical protein
VIPEEVKEAAEVLEEWCTVEARKMRAACAFGPAVMMFELVAVMCDYFLTAVGARPRKC